MTQSAMYGQNSWWLVLQIYGGYPVQSPCKWRLGACLVWLLKPSPVNVWSRGAHGPHVGLHVAKGVKVVRKGETSDDVFGSLEAAQHTLSSAPILIIYVTCIADSELESRNNTSSVYVPDVGEVEGLLAVGAAGHRQQIPVRPHDALDVLWLQFWRHPCLKEEQLFISSLPHEATLVGDAGYSRLLSNTGRASETFLPGLLRAGGQA